ncbi:hypothetical protein [uncultured Paludibaculum sp.]|uniref:hypothetical protein n=1 Tax=uncultured Paludibaculum sp. TaxID=1765020 RepID=UPI002AAA99AC|nr:hypothetical protein [uncultured Paludibaculum sp.]
MRRTPTLWILAFLITVASAVYQRMTGPSYPVRGKATLAGTEIAFRLPRSQGDGDAEIRVPAADVAVQGTLGWKRFKTKDSWTYSKLTRQAGELVGHLPHQPPAGKLMYRVILQQGLERVSLHGQPVVIRFKGEVPQPVLMVHIFCMFVGMLLSTRAGLEFFRPEPKYATLIVATIGLLTVGGLILGPVVQKYAFGAYWTGWPFGTDLTDNKTAVAWLAWVIAWLKTRRNQEAGRWALGAAIVTLVVFGIPHSVFGSELKYD